MTTQPTARLVASRTSKLDKYVGTMESDYCKPRVAALWQAFRCAVIPLLADRRPTTERLKPGISHIDIPANSCGGPHIVKKFTRQSHLASSFAPNRLF
jgi:hypothetical protein